MDPSSAEELMQRMKEELQEARRKAEAWSKKAAYFHAEAHWLEYERVNAEVRFEAVKRNWEDAELAFDYAVDVFQEMRKEVKEIKAASKATWTRAVEVEQELQLARIEIRSLRKFPPPKKVDLASSSEDSD